MSNKVYKNYQINVGIPFQVRVPIEERYAQPDFGYENGGLTPSGYETGDLFDGLGLFEADFTDAAAGAGGAYGEGSVNVVDTVNVVDAVNDVNDVNDVNVYNDGEAGPAAPAGGARAASMEEKARAAVETLIREARAESADIIARAETEANRIIDAAKFKAERSRDKTIEEASLNAAKMLEQAHAEGLTEGRREGKAEYDGLIGEARLIRGDAEREYKTLIAGAEADALDLILGIAEKVIGEEIEYNRKSLIYLVRDAFANCTNKENVILKVSPNDFEYICDNRDTLLSMAEGLDNLEIKKDLALIPGACNIETPFGNLDAGVLTRFIKIKEAFYAILAANQPADDDMSA